MNTPKVGRSKAARNRKTPCKRILSVTVRRMVDTSPDTSWLGEYSNKATSQYSISRAHDEDCPRFWANDDIPDDVRECDCGNIGSRQLPYFNPPDDNYKGESDADIRKYCLQDYQRMESLNNGNWCFIGIRADAEIGIPNQYVNCDGKSDSLTIQRITSGELWGIESDSERTYIEEEERNQLDDLRVQLAALGFSGQAITRAFADVQHKDS